MNIYIFSDPFLREIKQVCSTVFLCKYRKPHSLFSRNRPTKVHPAGLFGKTVEYGFAYGAATLLQLMGCPQVGEV